MGIQSGDGLKPNKDEQKINELGAQGWELVHVIPNLAEGTYVSKADLIFRRSR